MYEGNNYSVLFELIHSNFTKSAHFATSYTLSSKTFDNMSQLDNWYFGDFNSSLFSTEKLLVVRLQRSFACISLALSVFGVLENLVSLMALLSMRRPWEAFHILLLNLAVADLVVVFFSSVGTSLYIYVSTSEADDSSLICVGNIFSEMAYLFLLIPILTTSGLVVQQYIAISKPLAHKALLTKGKAMVYMGFSWLFGIVITLALPFFSKLQDGEPIEIKSLDRFCRTFLTKEYYTNSAYTMAVIFALVVTALGFFYVRLFFKVKKHFNVKEKIGRNNSREGEQQAKVKVTIGLLFGTVICFWIPGIVDGLIVAHSQTQTDCVACAVYHHVAFNFILANSLTDPLIYGIRLPQVRLGYRRLFRSCIRQRKRSSIRFLQINGSSVTETQL